jgi:NAD+ synthase (glutamine-hydrolysing)
MKIALAQLNYHIGNFDANIEKIISSTEEAKAKGADLIVFSELSVCGYPPLDLLEQKDFIGKCEDAISRISGHSHGIGIIIGTPVRNKSERGKMLLNAALFLHNGKVEDSFYKTLLPTYDIFDEYRYFEPNHEFHLLHFNGYSIAITICEDLWDTVVVENSFSKENIYKQATMEHLAPLNPDLIINIAASPFSYDKDHLRNRVLQENAQRWNVPIVYVNQVGANTEIIFDGASKVLNKKGQILHSMKSFAEDFIVFDFGQINDEQPIRISQKTKIEKIHEALILGLRDFFGKNGFKSATLGLSGGIDSAVVLALAAEAIGSQNIRVLLLPSEFSSEHSITDAVALAEKLGVTYDIVKIQEPFEAFKTVLNPLFAGLPFGLAEENLQARIRGSLLMAVSNKFGNILLNTSNKSEAAVGYGTLYGDMNGGLSILGDVYKTDVYALAHYINRDEEIIPTNTITKAPSAELRPDQKDSDSLPEYDVLDNILFAYIEQKLTVDEIVAQKFDRYTVERTIKMVNNNEFKRFQCPPILRISSKAFGLGRRMPLVAKY